MFHKLRTTFFPKPAPEPDPDFEQCVPVELSRMEYRLKNRPLPEPLTNTLVMAAKEHLTDPDLTADLLSYTVLYWENMIDADELRHAFDWITMQQSLRWTVRVAQLRDEGIEYTTLQKTFLAVVDATCWASAQTGMTHSILLAVLQCGAF